MSYAHAPLPQVEPAEYWCPTCRCPVVASQVRTIYTGGVDETIHNHRNHVVRDGVARQVDHTVTRRRVTL